MNSSFDRRTFIKSTAAIGAGLFLSPHAIAADGGNDDINIALLGAGSQGQVLMNACLKMGKDSGVKFRAVCDIWETGNLQRVSRILNAYKAYGHAGTPYIDYKEMLDKEKDLDAVIIATPDFWHSEHTIACLNAGLNVYCEKEMSNTLEGARKMVEAARQSGKLLQIGHQRRSNPRYLFCYDNVIKKMNLLGRITTINGQWNRSKSACEDAVWPEGTEIDEVVLNKFGYKNMKQFANWRWYKGLGGGPIVDLGSHQIDIYNWFLGAKPKSVMASGGLDYWKGRDWYDSVMSMYEYETKQGIVRAFYQTITTNSSNGYYENFMGENATLVISEASHRGSVYRETHVEEIEWEQWVKDGLLLKADGLEQPKDEDAVVDIRQSPTPPKYDIPVIFNDPYHMPHLANFFNAVRGKEKLNCPAEDAYETAVTVLKVNDAVEAGKRLEFRPEEFKV